MPYASSGNREKERMKQRNRRDKEGNGRRGRGGEARRQNYRDKNPIKGMETYKKIYPSVALTPTAYPVIKAHKPEKNYPVRIIT